MYNHELPTCPGRGSLEQAGLPSKQGGKKPTRFSFLTELLAVKSLPAELQGWGVGGKGCLQREQPAAVHPQMAALWGRGRAGSHRPWIQEPGDKVAMPPSDP